jgi:Ca2+/Na+ antiporter
MGNTISHFFPPIPQFPDIHKFPSECISTDEHEFEPIITFFGIVQLSFLGFIYGYIVLLASNLIADGSELLLLIPAIAPVVGSVVLPILGAVPDGCMVLFSGLGPRSTVQNDLAVGVGALAGSTIMLLTVPWFLAVLSGRADIDYQISPSTGIKTIFVDYLRRPKLSESATISTSGVEPHRNAMKIGAYAMLFTTLPYLIIQGSALAYSSDSDNQLAKDEQWFALVGLIICGISFLLYLRHHFQGAKEDEVLINLQDNVRVEAVRRGIISLQAAFQHALQRESFHQSLGVPLIDLDPTSEAKRLKLILHHFFAKYDTDNSRTIDARELNLLLADLRCPHSPQDVEECLKAMDADHSGDISFDEFVIGMTEMITHPLPDRSFIAHHRSSNLLSHDQQQQQQQHQQQRRRSSGMAPTTTTTTSSSSLPPPTTTQYGTLSQQQNQQNQQQQTQPTQPLLQRQTETDGLEDDDNSSSMTDEIPEDLAHLPVEEQRRQIIIRAIKSMGLGVLLVMFFSDPLVDVMSEMGKVLGVSPFYISFIFAPLASNASEIIASYGYAMKKTSKTITISLSTLMGAAIMNNTFVLGIFLSLVRFRELEWKFTAETFTILFVELIMCFIALRKVQTLRLAIFVLSLCPLALVLVWFLENVVGWD